jgi:hypothetical protein
MDILSFYKHDVLKRPVGDEVLKYITVEFTDADHLRKFISNDKRVFKVPSRIYNGVYDTFKIVKIEKIKHRSIICNIINFSLREHNLDIILS